MFDGAFELPDLVYQVQGRVVVVIVLLLPEIFLVIIVEVVLALVVVFVIRKVIVVAVAFCFVFAPLVCILLDEGDGGFEQFWHFFKDFVGLFG